MTTVEKLLVQIFERKNSIIEQVRQQTELYSQHLASKLLIDGIAPPSWLWDANASSNSKELNKEEVISKLLHPHPQPQSSACCSFTNYPFCSNLATTEDNEAFSEKVFMENMVFSKGYHRQDGSMVPELRGEDHAGCAIEIVPEPDASVTSPEDRTDERILNNCNVAEQSVSGIHRSRSRQKALELRNSAKSKTTSCSSHENIRKSLSNQIGFPLSSTNPVAPNDEVEKLAEHVFGSQSFRSLDGETNLINVEKEMGLYSRNHSKGPVVRDFFKLGCSSEDWKDSASSHDVVAKLAESHVVGSQSYKSLNREADPLSKEKEMDLYSSTVARSRNHSQGSLVRDSLTLGCACKDCKDSASCHVANVWERGSMLISDSEHVANSVIKKLGMSNQPSAVCCQSCGNGINADWVHKDKETDAGRIMGSKISVECHCCACDSARAGSSFDDYQRLGAAIMDGADDLPPDNVNGPLVAVRSSNVCSEDCEARGPISEDCENHGGRFTISSLCVSQLNTVEDVSHPEIHCHFVKSDGCIPTPSSRRSRDLFNYSNELLGLVKPSVGPFHRVTRSQTRSNDQEEPEPSDNNQNPCLEGTLSTSDCKQKSANIELHIVNRSSPLCETHDMVGKDEIDGFSIPCNVKKRIQLESLTVPTPSGSFEVVESLQPTFIENEESNLKASASSSQKRRFANSAEKMSCPFADPAMFLDKGVSGDVNQHPIGKQSVSKSDCKKLQLVNRIPSLYETRDMLGEHEISCLLIPSNAKERRKSNSVEPMQPNFIENKEHDLEASVSCPLKRRITNSAEKMSCSMPNPAICVEKGISADVIRLSTGKPSQGMPDVSDKVEEAKWDLFESDAQENPSTVADKFGCAAVGSDYTSVRTCEDNRELERNYKISEVHQEADIMASTLDDVLNMQIHPSKLQVEHGFESFLEQHKEEGDQGGEGIDNSRLMSNSSERETSGTSHLRNAAKAQRVDSSGSIIGKIQMKNSIFDLDKIENFSAQVSQNSLCLEDDEVWSQPAGCSGVGYPPGEENSLSERRYVHAGMECSWPQRKRRKIEHLQSHSSTSHPISKARMPWSSLRSLASNYAENLKSNGDAIMLDTHDVVKSTVAEAFENVVSNSIKGIKSTFSSHEAEVTFCYKEKNVEQDFSSVNTEQLGAVPSLTKEARNSQGCLVERMSTLHSSSKGAGEAHDGRCNHQVKISKDLRSKTLTPASIMLDEMQSLKWEGDPQVQPFVFSPNADDLNLIDVDQSMPVFEGFTVQAEADSGELEFEANGFNFNKIELPRNAIERASVLAEICKSACLNTPLSHFSSSSEFQGTRDLPQSVSDDYYEHLNMQSTLPLSSDVEKQPQSGSVHADFRAYSGVLYDWNSRNHYGSPVGKLWGEPASHSGSSGKSSNSNPELVCFPIEEDPCGSEESTSADEHADDIQEKNDPSSAGYCDRRQPLKDLTNLDLNPHVSVSAQEEMFRADSVDFMSQKLSVSRARDKVQLSTTNQYRDGSRAIEKDVSHVGSTDDRNSQTLSVGTNAIIKTKESISMISKPSMSNKTSLQRQDQKISLKESRRNNIVSNVNSFKPLVQQKKVSAVCTGKRDVKVKALEAAEAAKRLEEKRENVRKMRKEALKVERAKLEEMNLRNLELEKKKREEERKKREADNMTKKRLREEEAKKEKKKKKRNLETRQHRREQEEKICTEKGGKEKQQSKDDQMKSKKEFHNIYKKQNIETIKGDDTALEKTETKWMPTDVAMNYEECGTSGQPCEAEKAKHTLDMSPMKDLIVQNSQEKSYEISPYQCSDDEDEEEDELPTKKYIPSWASKSSVALLLPLQQDLDPAVVFPPNSLCSIDEVLPPRKLPQKQIATALDVS